MNRELLAKAFGDIDEQLIAQAYRPAPEDAYPALQGRGNREGNLFGRGADRASEKARHSQDNLCGISGIVNFLLNCGSRAATVRAIQIRDVDLDGGVVFYRHTKNRKAQVIPLCSPMVAILREYGRYRGGEPTDYLFCTETGTQLTENGLRQSIARYNTRRGVQKTSIHLFRHTFARKYLIDCGGDAFTLQKLLGHSTLAMTKHYCAIYDADLTKNYDNFSPLAQMKASGAKIKMPAKGR